MKEIEFVVKNFPTEKTPGPDGFLREFHQLFRKKYQFYTDSLENSRGRNTP